MWKGDHEPSDDDSVSSGEAWHSQKVESGLPLEEKVNILSQALADDVEFGSPMRKQHFLLDDEVIEDLPFSSPKFPMDLIDDDMEINGPDPTNLSLSQLSHEELKDVIASNSKRARNKFSEKLSLSQTL
jgi:hypothetical protein